MKNVNGIMTKMITAIFARTQFGQILEKVRSSRTRFVVGKRGEPVAVIIGIQDFIKNFAPEPEVLTLLGKASVDQGTDALSLDEINREIKAARKMKTSANAA